MFAAKVTPESLADFNKALEEYAREVGWSMEYTSLFSAAWLCRDTMWYTPPFVDGSFQGTTKAAEKVGNAALARDIGNIFKPLDARAKRAGPGILLHKLAVAAKTGRMSDYFDAQQMAKDIPWDSEIVRRIVNDADPVRGYYKAQNFFAAYTMGEVKQTKEGLSAEELRPIHEKMKVTRGGRMVIKKPTTILGYHLVKSKQVLSQYIAMRQKMIGKIKSGWWRVMMSLPKPKKKGRQGSVGGIRDIAKFIKRHGGSAGYQATSFSKTDYKVVIGNRIGDTDAVATRVNAPGMALAQVEERLENELKRTIEGDVRQFNKG